MVKITSNLAMALAQKNDALEKQAEEILTLRRELHELRLSTATSESRQSDDKPIVSSATKTYMQPTISQQLKARRSSTLSSQREQSKESRPSIQVGERTYIYKNGRPIHITATPGSEYYHKPHFMQETAASRDKTRRPLYPRVYRPFTPTKTELTEMDSTETDSTEMNSTETDSTEMDSTETDSTMDNCERDSTYESPVIDTQQKIRARRCLYEDALGKRTGMHKRLKSALPDHTLISSEFGFRCLQQAHRKVQELIFMMAKIHFPDIYAKHYPDGPHLVKIGWGEMNPIYNFSGDFLSRNLSINGFDHCTVGYQLKMLINLRNSVCHPSRLELQDSKRLDEHLSEAHRLAVICDNEEKCLEIRALRDALQEEANKTLEEFMDGHLLASLPFSSDLTQFWASHHKDHFKSHLYWCNSRPEYCRREVTELALAWARDTDVDLTKNGYLISTLWDD